MHLNVGGTVFPIKSTQEEVLTLHTDHIINGLFSGNEPYRA